MKKEGKTAKLTGCVESQGGGYALVDKKHPNGVQLVGSQDLSSHVGHKVEVKGTWEAASASTGGTGSSADTTASAGTSGAGGTSASGTSGTSGDTSTSASNTGAGTSGSSASSLPQSDQGAMGGEALRVTDIKMKSDKCETASNNTSSPK
jgi:hypothetical protein